MVNIVGIRNSHKEYPDWTKQEFLTLDDYITGAVKTIRYYAPKLKAGLVERMTNDEDAISSVAHAMMIADWKYDESKGMTRYNFRNNCALFAIRSYIIQSAKSKKHLSMQHPIKSPKTSGDGIYLEDMLKNSKTCEPIDELISLEDTKIDDVKNKISSGLLTERESACVYMYYIDDMTYQDIGDTLGITKQRVEQLVKKGVQRLKCSMSK